MGLRKRTAASEEQFGQPAPTLEIDGHRYRDLNGDGRLNVYEDSRAPIADRVEDLLSQMTVEEKVGLMFHTPVIVSGKDGIDGRIKWGSAGLTEMVTERHLNHFNLLTAPEPAATAAWHNRVQRLAERTRLGVPVTISSDPRHAAGFNPGAGIKQKGFSEWPSQLGLAAAADEELVEQFGDVGRREFRAMGIRTVLNPMADVATEPRWGRVGGTFGDDYEEVGRLTSAYVRGFQGGSDGVGTESVSCMVKHFPGGGPQEEGSEPHSAFGANQLYPGGRIDDHVEPFRQAFAAGARQVMLSYGIPVGETSEDVAMAYNREIVTDLLRQELGFDGVVCTDWMTHETEKFFGYLTLKEASAWGVEDLDARERYAKSIDIGVDQFGGQSDPSTLVSLVSSGEVSEERIDESVRRILRLKFELGLFDDPYVDERAASSAAGTQDFVSAGIEAQRHSMVLLTNKKTDLGSTLPAEGQPRLYVRGVKKKVAAQYGHVVSSPAKADLAIINVASPTERKLRKEILSLFFPQGDLRFSHRKLKKILGVCSAVPTVVTIRVDRPPVIPEIAEEAAAVFASFGVTDEVLLDAVFGRFSSSGKLPVEMPSSMRAVVRSDEDVAGTEDPLFERGVGLTYGEDE